MSTPETDLMSMSDDDIMNMVDAPPAGPGDIPEPKGDLPETGESGSPDAPAGEGDPEPATDPKGEGASPSGSEETPEGEEEEEEENPLNLSDEDAAKQPEKKTEKASDKKDEKKESKPEDKPGEKPGDENKGDAKPGDTPAEAPVDYEAAYKKLMGPIKASGRTMQLQSVDEALSLIQKGVDYTRRMQQLQPHLKLVRMLEKNGMLDEKKLSHFIDLDKKDPAAVAKFLKDRQIDPLDLDMDKEADYKPGNHAVSNEEMTFQNALEDIQSTPTGKETIGVIDKEWDQVSKSRVYKEPAILRLMDVHRSTGIYEQITGEMARLTALDVIPKDTPFLDAYKSVGDNLHKHGKLLVDGKPTNALPVPKVSAAPKSQAAQPEAKPEAPATPAKTERRVLETRPAKPKPAASNGEAAKAAGTTRSTPAKQTADFNPLALSDEEFEKQAAGNFRL